MIVTFCGHAQFNKTDEYEQKVLAFLEEKVGDKAADMYLGGYGGFDGFAYDCCVKFKEKNPKVSLVFIVPYMTEQYQKNCLDYQKARYDLTIYPEIENKPQRYAIIYRNRYMVEKADFVVAYITHDWGGAYKTYQYAKRKKKTIFNISGKEV